jgi:TPP-dependent 2-oxoacid decarboxylase
MNIKAKEYIPFMQWIIEVAEEKISEHTILKKEFKSHEEFIVFTIIWMRVYKDIIKKIKIDNSNESIDTLIKNFYKEQKNAYLGITINAITRESLIPRSTVKRIVENLILEKLVSKNVNRLIIPNYQVRDKMKKYRQYIFKSNKKLSNLFLNLNLEDKYDEENL